MNFSKFETEVKQKIRYEQVLKTIDPRRGIHVKWPDPVVFLPNKGAGWTMTRDDTHISDIAGLVSREFIYESGDAELVLKLFVSSRGAEPVMRQVVETIMATTMWDAYETGPVDLGALCLVLGTPPASVLVVFHNVLLQIRIHETETDALAIARAATEFMRGRVVPDLSQYLPMIQNVVITPTHPRVNEIFRIDVVLPDSSNAGQLIWDYFHDVDSADLDQVERGHRHVLYKASKAGGIDMSMRVADRTTLLSSEKKIRVDISP